MRPCHLSTVSGSILRSCSTMQSLAVHMHHLVNVGRCCLAEHWVMLMKHKDQLYHSSNFYGGAPKQSRNKFTWVWQAAALLQAD